MRIKLSQGAGVPGQIHGFCCKLTTNTRNRRADADKGKFALKIGEAEDALARMKLTTSRKSESVYVSSYTVVGFTLFLHMLEHCEKGNFPFRRNALVPLIRIKEYARAPKEIISLRRHRELCLPLSFQA